ncbi:hypothetical protein O181_118021 [Austropuccinia psidii MF-1]|uniref:Tf2-1-like SH3-like domain-containing protein n=1 Tax=Austropuccinia psidii MF-1 TaxID=1389203 RepID=A0A9Q3KDS7_9BASI|nr:hypothetical protein [Austropuccinia psidii MF-1]
MEPYFKEGDQVLVSALNSNNLKEPKKMRDSFLGPFTIIKLIEENAVEIRLTVEFSRKHPVFPHTTPPEIVEVEDSPGAVKNIIKARNIRLNGKDQRQYFVRFRIKPADKDKWLADVSIPDGNPHLRRFRASRRTEHSHQ